MKKFFKIPCILFLAACTDASETIKNSELTECEFEFNSFSSCQVGKFKVDITVEKVSSDEVQLKFLDVTHKGSIHSLKISEDVSFILGDKGYIFIEDINFDGQNDLSITTSFGIANLYLDYWIFDDSNDQFVYIGNFSQLSKNSDNKTLVEKYKVNAETYKVKNYKWEGTTLVEQ